MTESYLTDTLPQVVEEIPPRALQIVTDAMSLEQSLTAWSEQRKVLTQFIKHHLVEGSDYGKIHVAKCDNRYTCTNSKHFSKDCLFKAGSEKFLGLLRLKPNFQKDDPTWEMLGRPPGVICLICFLVTDNAVIVGEGRGIRDSQKDGGDYNKSIKMAQKSAQLDAILRTGCLSDVFTQDLDDMMGHEEVRQTSAEPAVMTITANGMYPVTAVKTNTSAAIWRETLRIQRSIIFAVWPHLSEKSTQALEGLKSALRQAENDPFYPDSQGLKLADAVLQWVDKLDGEQENVPPREMGSFHD